MPPKLQDISGHIQIGNVSNISRQIIAKTKNHPEFVFNISERSFDSRTKSRENIHDVSGEECKGSASDNHPARL
jgi:hypothetical protein